MVQKFSRINVYNALALPILLYGSEIWTLRKKDEKQSQSIEMKFFRRIAGYIIFDHKRNEEILEELQIEPIDVEAKRIQIKLATTCSKNEQNRTPRIMLYYRPNGRRRLGKLLKRLLDEAETGLSRRSS